MKKLTFGILMAFVLGLVPITQAANTPETRGAQLLRTHPKTVAAAKAEKKQKKKRKNKKRKHHKKAKKGTVKKLRKG